MNSGVVRRWFLICAILLLPVVSFAQEAALTGTVADSSGGVLPGVTVVATNQATGSRFEGDGGDLRQTGNNFSQRLRPDGTSSRTSQGSSVRRSSASV